MSTTNGAHPKGRRYPVKVIRFAERSTARGHTWQMIAAAIEANGYPAPTRTTIREWADPDAADIRRARQRKRTTKRPERKALWRIILDRMHELRSLRVSFNSIAKIINNDFGTDLTKDAARSILNGKLSDESVQKWLGV